MKKILVILTLILVSVVLLTISAMADGYVFTADQLDDMVTSKTSNVSYQLMSADDTQYLKLYLSQIDQGGNFDKTNTNVRFDFFDSTPLFNVDDYPFVAISYKTNIEMTNNKFSINAGMKTASGGSYVRCWGLSYTGVTNEQRNVAIYDVRNFSGSPDVSSLKYDAIDTSGGIKFVRIPAWADSATSVANELADDYFAIEFVGFFPSAYEAFREFDKSEYTITYYNKDGNVHKTYTGLRVGDTHTTISGISVSGLTFKRWVNSSGTPVPSSFNVEDNYEFYPEYTNATDYYIYYPEMFGEVTTTKLNKSITDSGRMKFTVTENSSHGESVSFTININDIFNIKDSTNDKNGYYWEGYDYVAIKYKTDIVNSSFSWGGKTITASVKPTVMKAEANDPNSVIIDNGEYVLNSGNTVSLSGDGSDHVAVVDLSGISDVELHTNVKSLTIYPSTSKASWGGKDIQKGAYIEIEYIGFFKSQSAAQNFDATTAKLETHYPFMEYNASLNFNPDKNLTRGDAAKALAAMILKGADVPTTNTSKYTDLNTNSKYYYAVAYLEKLGYLTANGGEYDPNGNIKRSELINLINAISDDYSHISKADTTVASGTYITRINAAELMCKALGRKPTLEGVEHVSVAGPKDITKDNPQAAYVMEACYAHTKVDNWDKNELWVASDDDSFYMKKASEGLIENLNQQLRNRAETIRASESQWEDKLGVNGKVYYVSNNGNDSNNGLSEAKPFKTIGKVQDLMNQGKIKAGDVILFERGGEWYPTESIDANGMITQTKLSVKAGITVSAYGEGDKPRILASINASDEDKWSKVSGYDDLYVFYMPICADRDVGNIVFNDGTFHWENGRPVYDNSAYGLRLLDDPKTNNAIQAGHNDSPDGSYIVSNGPTQWVFNTEDYTFNTATDLQAIADAIPESDLMFCHDEGDQKLYIISKKGNPGKVFDRIDLCTKGNGVGATTGVTLDNLCIKFTGSHGVGAGSCSNLTIRNCEVGYIGGSVQIWDSKTRYGNAVEVYGEADGFYVYDCFMYQCFDCGPTVQVTQKQLTWGDPLIEKDVHFYGNALWNAALEVWLSTGQENFGRYYAALINCKMYDNLVAYNGYGFQGYTHYKHDFCGFYGAGYTYADYIDCYMENNTFWNLRMNLLKAVATSTDDGHGFHWRNNTIIMKYDGYLGLLGADVDNAIGASKRYFYNNETVKKLVGSGSFGHNNFMYTLPEGMEDPNPEIFGDINGDGEMSALDKVYFTRFLVGWSGYTIDDVSSLDFDSNGTVGTTDLIAFARHLAGWKGYEFLPLGD